jgi:biopolymer transport protein ExbD
MNQEFAGDDELQPLLHSKTYDDSEMDITPMIDITFLLLIFFLVASKMDAAADVRLPPARHGLPVVEKSSAVITLVAGEEGKAIVYKGNGVVEENRVDGSDIEAQEDEIAAYVEEEMAHPENPRENVLIKAEKGILHREVSRISKAATRPEGVLQLYVAVLEVQN